MKSGDAPNPLFYRLRWPLRLTWLGIVGDRFLNAFWPSFSLSFAFVAAMLFGLHEQLPLIAVYGASSAIAAILIVLLSRGIAQFHFPSRAEVVAKLDESLIGHPLATLTDAQTLGVDDPASRAVWQTHLKRMERNTLGARAPLPELKLRDRDPNGLRLMALTALLTAVLFGAPKHFRSVPILADNLAGSVASNGALWEGWVQPPSYTGKPNLYLNDLIDHSEIMVPQGSQISMRFYSEKAANAFEHSLAKAANTSPSENKIDVTRIFVVEVERSGRLAITGEFGAEWHVKMLLDEPPTIAVITPEEVTLDGELKQDFEARDDYGVASGEAQFSLALEENDRRFGLLAEPDPRQDWVLDLPLPYSRNTILFEETLSEDFAAHPWAGLTVNMSLMVADDLSQNSDFEPVEIQLPKRKFFHPLAASVVEMRRDILWARSNSHRAEQILRAVTHRPEGIEMDRSGFLMLRVALNRLKMANTDGLDKQEQEMIADALWEIALRFEEGGLEDAKARLERAQDRLAEAMERGAGEEEIAELMDELRRAMDDYMQQLANNADPNADQQSAENQDSTSVTQDEIDALMDQIQELMEQGRMAEAQQLLEMLREMMENMQVTQGSGGDGPQTPGERAMDGLQETLRDQQELSDESFRDLQERYNPSDPQDGESPSGQGEEGSEGDGATAEDQQGQGGGDGDQQTDRGQPGGEQSLAQRQQALRDALRQQERGLPSDGDGGTGEALDRAGRAMEEAADALENDDTPLALDRQSEAIEELREGMRSLGQALAEEQSGSDGEAGEGEQAQGLNSDDPLGREAGTAGALGGQNPFADDESPYGRARELLEELRRREGDKSRPEQELEYLKRLLDQF